ncbi:hypothetical protein ACFVIM_04755 [Streptomyces sp. NPDC057638]|uniref:hypothetical protein n=1 Tax=Streptomyces sp. NPDC057638 TaxID=3346190 RepID=UPI0036819CBB
MPPRPHRPLLAAALTALATVFVGGLAGCADPGGLESAGPTPTATGPVRLWPDLPPVTAPPYDYGETDTALIDGLTVPEQGVRALDPLQVLRKEIGPERGGPGTVDGLYPETADRLRSCGPRRSPCPLLRPHYRDLTGDGREELIVGLTMPEQQTAVRVYTPERRSGSKQTVTMVLRRVLATYDQLVSVEVAGRDLVTRSVSAGIPGYEYRTVWSWDSRTRALLPARDEIVQVTKAPTGPPERVRPSGGATSPRPAENP